MRKLGYGLLGIVVCLALAGNAFAQDGWIGLWKGRVVSESREGEIYLAISKKSGKFEAIHYTKDWVASVYTVVSLDDSKMVLDSPVISKSFRYTLERTGEQAKGIGELIHPQYKFSIDMEFQRMVPANNWKPLRGIEQTEANGVVDIWGRLLREAPLESFDGFKKYWNKEIASLYYFTLSDVLFDQPSDTFDVLDVNLRKIFDRVKSEKSSESGFDLVKAQKAIVQELKTKYPALYYKNTFVFLPSLEKFESTVLYLDESFVVRIGVDSVEKKLGSRSPTAWLAKEQLKLPFFRPLPPWEKDSASVALREGLAARLAVSKGFAETLEDCYVSPPPARATDEDLESYKKELWGQFTRRVGKELEEWQVVQVGYALADQLLSSFGPEELVAMEKTKLLSFYAEFIKPPEVKAASKE